MSTDKLKTTFCIITYACMYDNYYQQNFNKHAYKHTFSTENGRIKIHKRA